MVRAHRSVLVSERDFRCLSVPDAALKNYGALMRFMKEKQKDVAVQLQV